MELKQTIGAMNSANYKERFKAEYLQLKIRLEKLDNLLNKIEASMYSSIVEMPKFDCPYELLREQKKAMEDYLHTLKLRAIFEEIDLDSLNNLD